MRSKKMKLDKLLELYINGDLNKEEFEYMLKKINDEDNKQDGDLSPPPRVY